MRCAVLHLAAALVALLACGDAAAVYAADPPSLIEAARNADAAALRTLIRQGADVNAAAADGTTALHWASYRDNLDMADALIRAGAFDTKLGPGEDVGQVGVLCPEQQVADHLDLAGC